MACNILKCQCGGHFIPQRYILCFMCFFGIMNAYSLRLCLNIALTEILEAKPRSNTTMVAGECTSDDVSKPPPKGGTYQWTPSQEGMVLGAFFPGYVLTHIPGGILSDTIGGRHPLSLCVLASGLLSFFTPAFIKLGGWWLLSISRFCIGLAQGFMFPAVSTLLAKWIPKGERGTLASLVLASVHIGSITGTLVSGFLILKFKSWPIVFYFWGSLSVIWYFFFLFMCFSEPSQHPFITTEEADMLAQEIGPSEKLPIPWKKLLFYAPTMALMAGEIGHGAVFFLVVTDLPKYMKDVLKFEIKENAIFTALPYLALWICSCISGIISDKLINSGKVSVITIRKLYTTIASVGPSVCCVVAVYLGCSRIIAASMFILCMFTMGPFYPGMRVNALDITKNFAGILLAFVNGMGALAFTPIPPLISLMTKNHTSYEWRNVFWLVFVISSVTNVIYVVWASAERAEWDKSFDGEE